jgi:hypothetical protein
MKLLKQLHHANKLVIKLFQKMNFKLTAPEHQLIKQHMMKGYKLQPTPMNIKKYLLKQLLTPIEDVPEPERTIILRAGKHDF